LLALVKHNTKYVCFYTTLENMDVVAFLFSVLFSHHLGILSIVFCQPTKDEWVPMKHTHLFTHASVQIHKKRGRGRRISCPFSDPLLQKKN
jgi:hypothetical protein